MKTRKALQNRVAGHQGQIWALAHFHITSLNFDETQVIFGPYLLDWHTYSSEMCLR